MSPSVEPSALPDVSGLASVVAESWRAFGTRLTEIGFGSAYCASMWQVLPDHYPGLHLPIYEWRATRRDEPAAVVYRLFCLGHELKWNAVASALTGPVLATLLDAGLLVQLRPDIVRSQLQLRTLDDLFVLCDDPGERGDAVFGVGVGNQAFRGIVSARWTAGLAVDIGCGAGAAALTVSRHAERVVATDINERALALARVNAHLNGATNVDFRSGDLFEPLDRQTFDLLVAQPPYVPRPPLANDTTYLFGGGSGLDIMSRVLAGTAEHLARGGRAAIVYEAPLSVASGDIDPWCSLMPESGLHTLRLLGSAFHADAYSIRYALPTLRSGFDQFEVAVADMRTHLHDQGLAAIRPAVAVFERVSDNPGWAETVCVDGSLWDGIGPLSLWRLLRGISAVHRGPRAILAAPIHVPRDALIIERSSPADDGEIYLALPPSHLGRTSLWRRNDLELLRRLAAGVLDADIADQLDDNREIDLRTRALLAGLFGDEPGLEG